MAIERYESELEKLDNYVESLHLAGKRITAFGASGRANMLLGKLPKSRSIIEAVIDESPERVGRMMAQNQIPIRALERFDFSYYSELIILAWNYAEPIMKKLEYLELEFVIPLPSLKKITLKNHKDGRF